MLQYVVNIQDDLHIFICSFNHVNYVKIIKDIRLDYINTSKYQGHG